MPMAKKNSRSSEQLARTNEPEAKQKISNIIGYLYPVTSFIQAR
jgi:hypothetical protein